jgi:hypothetical protein
MATFTSWEDLMDGSGMICIESSLKVLPTLQTTKIPSWKMLLRRKMMGKLNNFSLRNILKECLSTHGFQ